MTDLLQDHIHAPDPYADDEGPPPASRMRVQFEQDLAGLSLAEQQAALSPETGAVPGIQFLFDPAVMGGFAAAPPPEDGPVQFAKGPPLGQPIDASPFKALALICLAISPETVGDYQSDLEAWIAMAGVPGSKGGAAAKALAEILKKVNPDTVGIYGPMVDNWAAQATGADLTATFPILGQALKNANPEMLPLYGPLIDQWVMGMALDPAAVAAAPPEPLDFGGLMPAPDQVTGGAPSHILAIGSLIKKANPDIAAAIDEWMGAGDATLEGLVPALSAQPGAGEALNAWLEAGADPLQLLTALGQVFADIAPDFDLLSQHMMLTQTVAGPAALDPVQYSGGGSGDTSAIHAAAAEGVKGSGSSLAHGDRIQQSFGKYDVSGIESYTGGAAAEANASMGSLAYASGNKIAFKSTPDLHTAAHEAAHIVQQAAGVSLQGGVGQVGDKYEKHADAVADRVVSGQSAESVLDSMAGGAPGVQKMIQSRSVQRRAVQFAATPGAANLDTLIGQLKGVKTKNAETKLGQANALKGKLPGLYQTKTLLELDELRADVRGVNDFIENTVPELKVKNPLADLISALSKDITEFQKVEEKGKEIKEASFTSFARAGKAAMAPLQGDLGTKYPNIKSSLAKALLTAMQAGVAPIKEKALKTLFAELEQGKITTFNVDKITEISGINDGINALAGGTMFDATTTHRLKTAKITYDIQRAVEGLSTISYTSDADLEKLADETGKVKASIEAAGKGSPPLDLSLFADANETITKGLEKAKSRYEAGLERESTKKVVKPRWGEHKPVVDRVKTLNDKYKAAFGGGSGYGPAEEYLGVAAGLESGLGKVPTIAEIDALDAKLKAIGSAALAAAPDSMRAVTDDIAAVIKHLKTLDAARAKVNATAYFKGLEHDRIKVSGWKLTLEKAFGRLDDAVDKLSDPKKLLKTVDEGSTRERHSQAWFAQFTALDHPLAAGPKGKIEAYNKKLQVNIDRFGTVDQTVKDALDATDDLKSLLSRSQNMDLLGRTQKSIDIITEGGIFEVTPWSEKVTERTKKWETSAPTPEVVQKSGGALLWKKIKSVFSNGGAPTCSPEALAQIEALDSRLAEISQMARSGKVPAQEIEKAKEAEKKKLEEQLKQGTVNAKDTKLAKDQSKDANSEDPEAGGPPSDAEKKQWEATAAGHVGSAGSVATDADALMAKRKAVKSAIDSYLTETKYKLDDVDPNTPLVNSNAVIAGCEASGQAAAQFLAGMRTNLTTCPVVKPHTDMHKAYTSVVKRYMTLQLIALQAKADWKVMEDWKGVWMALKDMKPSEVAKKFGAKEEGVGGTDDKDFNPGTTDDQNPAIKTATGKEAKGNVYKGSTGGANWSWEINVGTGSLKLVGGGGGSVDKGINVAGEASAGLALFATKAKKYLQDLEKFESGPDAVTEKYRIERTGVYGEGTLLKATGGWAPSEDKGISTPKLELTIAEVKGGRTTETKAPAGYQGADAGTTNPADPHKLVDASTSKQGLKVSAKLKFEDFSFDEFMDAVLGMNPLDIGKSKLEGAEYLLPYLVGSTDGAAEKIAEFLVSP